MVLRVRHLLICEFFLLCLPLCYFFAEIHFMESGVSPSICGSINLFPDQILFRVRIPEPSLPQKICYQFRGGEFVCVVASSYSLCLGGWCAIENPVASFSPLGPCTPWYTEYWLLRDGGYAIRSDATGFVSLPCAPSDVENDPSDSFSAPFSFSFSNSASCGQLLNFYHQAKNGSVYTPNQWGFAAFPPRFVFRSTILYLTSSSGTIAVEGLGSPSITIVSPVSCRFGSDETIREFSYSRVLPGSRVSVENEVVGGLYSAVIREYYSPHYDLGSPLSPPIEYSRIIAEYSSPPGCSLYPEVSWDCDGGCHGKRCPDGTCLKIKNGGDICCYGHSGEVLAVVPSYCEHADCDCNS